MKSRNQLKTGVSCVSEAVRSLTDLVQWVELGGGGEGFPSVVFIQCDSLHDTDKDGEMSTRQLGTGGGRCFHPCPEIDRAHKLGKAKPDQFKIWN